MAIWYAELGSLPVPARYDPFRLSAPERTLSGCPLFSWLDIASLREVWLDDSALCLTPDDQNDLQETLTALIHSTTATF